MKQITALLLAILLCISMTACGGGDESAPETKPAGSAPTNNAGTDSGADENVDPNVEAVKAALVGTWLPDGYGENQETAELLKFNEDGTVEMLGATYTWEVKSAGAQDSARIALYDGETCFYNAKYSVKDGVCNHLSLESVKGSGDKYKLEKIGYHREADYKVIEITLENYKDYFEVKEFVSETKDAFGDRTKIAIHTGIVLKEEFGKVAATLSHTALEYTFDRNDYEVTADKTTGEYNYGEKVRHQWLDTEIKDCKNLAVLDDRYGDVILYTHIDSFPSDTIQRSDNFTVTRAMGKIYTYTPAE